MLYSESGQQPISTNTRQSQTKPTQFNPAFVQQLTPLQRLRLERIVSTSMLELQRLQRTGTIANR